MQQFDIIVIGAGPAGSAAAAWAVRHGASVALIDKAVFPRSKLCGGLFTERSRSYYNEIFGEDIVYDNYLTQNAISFWHDKAEVATLHGIPPLHLTMRIDLDAKMHALALHHGAQDFSGQSISEIHADGVTLSSGQRLFAQVIIGADGVNSGVARHLFGQAYDKATIGFGLEVEVPFDEDNQPLTPLRIDFSAVRWGYGWSFPKHRSTTVGVGGMLAPNPDMKSHLGSYMDSLGVDDQQPRVKGHFLPFGDFKTHPGRANILLSGDAAGLVDPITGEGIAFAMKSGQLAAQSAMDAIAKSTPHAALNLYRRELRSMHLNLRIARNLRRIIFSPRWEQTFVSTFRKSSTVRLQYMRLLAGEVEYPQIAISVISRLPGYLWTRLRS